MIHPPLKRLTLAALLFLGSLASGFAVDNSTLLPQEQAIANDMIADPQQGRPTLIFDPIIEGVARAQARDMAVRNFFGDVNPDGVAANYLLRRAGYQLPSWWSTNPTVNNVGSIAAGYATPAAAWAGWMNSPPHKAHLLAQNSFYAGETHYGVGYYFDPNSTYQSYWVVITAPPQPLEITTPANAAKVMTPEIDVAGTADPGTNPASVQFRVENTSGIGAYQLATGVANWSGTAALAGGPNVIRAQSLDGSGNVIDERISAITYVVQGTLTVSVSGSGSITPGYAGATSRPVGVPIILQARPAPGCIFTGWTGSIVSGSALLRFTMQDGLGLQANFEPNPFPAVSGAYFGLLTTGSSAGSSAQSGLVRIAVSAIGRFTGRVDVDGGVWSFAGYLNPNGFATVTIPRRGKSALTVTVQADLAGGPVTGTVSDGTSTFDFTDSESTYNARTNPAPQAGRYTLVIESDPSVTGSSAPQASGYATIAVGTNGGAAVVGCLADGTPFSTTGCVANDGTLALYWASPGAAATLNGVLTFRPATVSDLDGTLAWTKAPKRTGAFYPVGFTIQSPCVGSRYARPLPGLPAMNAMNVAPGAATANFCDGNLVNPNAYGVPVTVSQTGRATMVNPGPPNVRLGIYPASGVVIGTFVPLGGKVIRAVHGVVLQKQHTAYGFFQGTNEAGSFSLVPVP